MELIFSACLFAIAFADETVVHDATYDESVLPADALPGLLANMRRQPLWLASGDGDEGGDRGGGTGRGAGRGGIDPDQEFRAALQLAAVPTGGPCRLAMAGNELCVLLFTRELAYWLGRPPTAVITADYVPTPEHWCEVEHWCGKGALRGALFNFSARVAPPPRPSSTRSHGVGDFSSTQNHFGTCAVVGSGGSLSGSGLGATIDTHDAVLRMNSAPTRGHEVDVGKRTTVRLTALPSLVLDQLETDEGRSTVLFSPVGLELFYVAYARFLHDGQGERPPIDPGSLHVIPFSSMWAMVSQWNNMFGTDPARRTPDAPCKLHSMGLTAVLWALGACERVEIFGFTTDPDATGYTHYYDKMDLTSRRPQTEASKSQTTIIRNQAKAKGSDNCHDLEYERAILRRLHVLGAIGIYGREQQQQAPSAGPPPSDRHPTDKVTALHCRNATIVAFVGARAGSQRVPRKNIRPFYRNRSILDIGLTELAAALAPWNSTGRGEGAVQIVFSSDSEEYNAIARVIPGVTAELREAYFASSECSVTDYHGHVGTVMSRIAPHATHVLFYQVTQPLLNRTTIRRFIEEFCKMPPEYDALLAVAKKVGHFIDKNGRPVNFDPQNIVGSQHLSALYVGGKMTILPVAHTLAHKNLLGTNPRLFEFDNFEALDIDSQYDFEVAQFLYAQRMDNLL